MADDSHWFEKLLMHFIPAEVDLKGETPEEMIAAASLKTFGISTAAALPPGPLGLMTILPELLTVTKIQMNLIYRIAAYYGKQGQVNATLILLIFANEAGLAIGRRVVTRMGTKLLIRTLGEQSVHSVSRSIAARIGARLTQKAVGRWIPFLLAPLFGLFSKKMTVRIGTEAVKLFSQDLELLEAPLLSTDQGAPEDNAGHAADLRDVHEVSHNKSL